MSNNITWLVNHFTEYELKRRLVTTRGMLRTNPSWQKAVIRMHEENVIALAIKQGKLIPA